MNEPIFPERDGVLHAVRVLTQGVPRYALVDGDRLALLDRAPWDGGQRDGTTIARANAHYSKHRARGENVRRPR